MRNAKRRDKNIEKATPNMMLVLRRLTEWNKKNTVKLANDKKFTTIIRPTEPATLELEDD